MKLTAKIFLLAFLVNLLEGIVTLYIFGVQLEKRGIIILSISSLVLALIIDKWILKDIKVR